MDVVMPLELDAGETEHALERDLYAQLGRGEILRVLLRGGSLDMLWCRDLERPQHEWVSPRLWERLGYDASTRSSLSCERTALIHPDDLALLSECERRHCADPENPCDQVVRYRCGDGSLAALRCRAVAVRDAGGRLVRLLGSHMEVSGSGHARDSIEQPALFLDAIIENIPHMVFVKDARALRFVRFNRAGEELLGVSRADLIGKSDYDLFPREEAEFFQAKDRETLRGKRLVEIPEEPILTPRGRRLLRTKKVPLLDEDGAPRYLLGISEDITERKAADEARARLVAIVSDSEDAIISQSPGGLIESWNRGAERIFGYTAEEAIGQPKSILFLSDDGDDETKDVSIVSQEEPLGSFETIRRRKDGRAIDVSITRSPVKNDSGERIGISLIARDITALKKIQRELVLAKDAALVANRELESFSYSVAHDLRAPLRSIDGFSQALLEDCGDTLDEAGRRHLGYVRESAQLMAQLIDDLLTLSRVTRSELRHVRTDLSALARASLARLGHRAPTRAVEIVIREGVEADGDPRLLAVVLDNLLGNAWKFSSKREHARIEFGVAPRAGELVYFVRDNGAGFDMAYAGKLFGAFQRLHNTRDFEGTGIGLATVQRIVHRHGGRVWGEAEIDVGATFHFTLGRRAST